MSCARCDVNNETLDEKMKSCQGRQPTIGRTCAAVERGARPKEGEKEQQNEAGNWKKAFPRKKKREQRKEARKRTMRKPNPTKIMMATWMYLNEKTACHLVLVAACAHEDVNSKQWWADDADSRLLKATKDKRITGCSPARAQSGNYWSFLFVLLDHRQCRPHHM